MKKHLLPVLLLAAGMATAQTPVKYRELPLGAVKPRGWLNYQLQTMRKGATGRLDEYYDKVRKDNGWLGGQGDAWEETPYWLDGALPLAYLLDDATLQAKVKRYVDWSLSTQRPNGFFGPYTKAERTKGKMETCQDGEDWWPRMVMLKVLQQYYTATNDKRVTDLMTRYFHYQLKNLKECPLVKWTEWAQSRGGDNMLTALWLYDQTKDPKLLELTELLYRQTTPWTRMFGERNWVMQAAANQTSEKWMDRHAVNVAMGLKTPAVYFLKSRDAKDLAALKTGFRDLMTLHGLPHGMFSGDEDLHGNEPTQGVELCAIVEAMFSLEQMIGITGDTDYMDALERMTFNALPAQTTDDYMSRQYFGIANQVQVSKGVYDFSLPFHRGMNNVYGHYAGYTCCTANMHQGWTKYASHLWYGTPDKGFAALVYGPNVLRTRAADGTDLTIEEETAYPFEDRIRFTISASKTVTLPLEFRIPNWCKEATVSLNGQVLRTEKGGKTVRLQRTWKSGDKLELHFPMEVRTSNWARNSRTVERGPLVYALKIREQFTRLNHPQEGEYYEIQPQSDWNFGLPKKTIEKPAESLEVVTRTMTYPFVWNADHAPVEIRATGRKIPAWKLVEGVARQPVTTREEVYQGEVDAASEPITLIPYGCTKLRVVAFPVVP